MSIKNLFNLNKRKKQFSCKMDNKAPQLTCVNIGLQGVLAQGLQNSGPAPEFNKVAKY